MKPRLSLIQSPWTAIKKFALFLLRFKSTPPASTFTTTLTWDFFQLQNKNTMCQKWWFETNGQQNFSTISEPYIVMYVYFKLIQWNANVFDAKTMWWHVVTAISYPWSKVLTCIVTMWRKHHKVTPCMLLRVFLFQTKYMYKVGTDSLDTHFTHCTIWTSSSYWKTKMAWE